MYDVLAMFDSKPYHPIHSGAIALDIFILSRVTSQSLLLSSVHIIPHFVPLLKSMLAEYNDFIDSTRQSGQL